ncbi:restriction endonuclease subunit R [Phormidium sp. CCY1219]|uniref:restriction endonuclease subunit R n=1 Tax=Phormidium sp. CCY1219 TaxID=2886104 RepID=UPI002D1F0495|nr:restriction endonuclease subunit R [Phormidium sp. CCY1219]MEB3831070.1 restriction endonuclease subunit R [Phormidium sp. CCY1219]
MTILQTKQLSLNEVHRLLKIQKHSPAASFSDLLSLEPLSEFEQQELAQIREDFENYLYSEKVSEGLVKALTTFPLMRLAGFYRSPIKISLEEDIAEITIEDEDTKITGRLDILAVNREKAMSSTDVSFWVLVIEAKNSGFTVYMGLPQLLVYAFKNLSGQESEWGLTTNGMHYQFVYMQQGNPPSYQLMPELNLMNPEAAMQLLQVLKAICQL